MASIRKCKLMDEAMVELLARRAGLDKALAKFPEDGRSGVAFLLPGRAGALSIIWGGCQPQPPPGGVSSVGVSADMATPNSPIWPPSSFRTIPAHRCWRDDLRDPSARPAFGLDAVAGQPRSE